MKAVYNYPEDSRNDWIKTENPQCVLTSSQIRWTNLTETAIQQKKLPEHCQRYYNQLKELVKMTREKLTREQRKVVNSMITLEVHSKDITENLKNTNVQNVN